MKNIAVIGANGAIGRGFVEQLSKDEDVLLVHAFSRDQAEFNSTKVTSHLISYDEESFRQAAENGPFDIVIVATGILHQDGLHPEKALRDLSAEKLITLFEINTVIPALAMKYFLPQLSKDKKSIFAALSARVGSISDNHLGGWYSYRASKAALNMLIKTASIELKRSHKKSIIIGLHPGTVDSPLSKPFQSHVPLEKLFSPEYSTQKMLDTLNQLTPEDSGKCFSYKGEEILP